jgi:hypothetical protein
MVPFFPACKVLKSPHHIKEIIGNFKTGNFAKNTNETLTGKGKQRLPVLDKNRKQPEANPQRSI